MPSYRDDGQLGEEIAALLPWYRHKTAVLEAAVHLLWRMRTWDKVKALILDLDLPLEEVVIRAVSDLWTREIGEPDRDLFAELDEVKRRLSAIERGNAMGWYVVSQHGSDGTPGIDGVEWCEGRPENSHTQTAFGPFATEEEAEAFKAKL